MKHSVIQPQLTIDPGEFERRLTAVISPLRRSLKNLHNELGRPKNTVAMQKQLSVGNTICWQVSRVIYADSAVSAARNAPLPQAMSQFLDAAERVGVSSSTLGEVRTASDQLRGFVKEHATDRASFETLLAGISDGDDVDTIQMSHRRAAYRSESHIWGVQRDVSGVIAFIRRTPNTDNCELAVVQCQHGYRRLRADASATVFAFGDPNEWGEAMWALDLDAMRQYGAPLLPAFCTDPIPQLARVPMAESIVYRLTDASVGRGGSKDLTTGIVVKQSAPARHEDGRLYCDVNHAVFCPTGRAVFALYLDRASFGGRVPAVSTNLAGFAPPDPRASVLPLRERLLPLGPGDTAAACNDIPDYGELVRYTASAAGLDLKDFDHLRMTIDFPVFASRTQLSVPID